MIKKICGVAVAATALCLGAATNSYAADLTVLTTNGAGQLNFTAYGDSVSICDDASDGLGVYGVVWNSTKSKAIYHVTNTLGYGTCVTKNASDGIPYDLTENTTYRFQICLYNASTHDTTKCNDVGYVA